MQVNISEESVIRFEGFELALKSGELRRAGEAVKLQPQPFKVLALLATHAGQLVTREEIQRQVWAGETFVDFEHGLNFCIKQIRAALGDSAHSPRYIETLPRRGYRFIAQVEEQAKQLPPVARQGPDGAGGRRRAAVAVPVLALTLAAVIAAALYLLPRGESVARPPAGKIKLAVLPFENLSADPGQDYLSDGLTEEMIARLGRLEPDRLSVIARTSSMTYKSSNKDIHRIGAELGVGYVLEGSVRRDGDRVRVTAQLIQVSDQSHLWAETYDRGMAGVLAVQSDVAGRIARALELQLLPDRRLEPVGHTAEPEAYEAYLRGRYLWNKGSREAIDKSIEYFNQAIERDAGFAQAHAGLADSYRLLGIFHGLAPREAFPKARAAAARAVELDDRLAEAHTALGAVSFWFDWDTAQAETHFKRALELNPNYALAHHDYAWLLVSLERFDEGLAEIKRAQELDPLSPLANSDVGWVYLRARRYDEAIEQMERTLELEPDFTAAQACLEMAYLRKGLAAEALEAALKQMARSGASPNEVAAIRQAGAAEGLRRVWVWRLDKRKEAAKKRSVSAYGFATIYAALGEKDLAFEWLERALAERDHSMISLKVDPACDNLRTDARFNEMVRRVSLSARAGRG